MDHDLILARYGELGLKSPRVRRRFEVILRDNIEHAFEQAGVDVVVRRVPGRFLLETSDHGAALRILTRVFGLTSVSPATGTTADLATLVPAAVAYARALRAAHPGARTFAVRSRRSGTHAYTSQDVAVRVGAAVLADAEAGQGLTVDLSKPDLALHVEVRGKEAYLFHDVVPGPGGLPLGTAGRVIVLLKDVNSLVAAWLMMKRGCTVLPLHLEGPTGSAEAARRHAALLKTWHLRGSLHEEPYSEAADLPKAEACALCVRRMMQKAAAYGRHRRAKAIVTGEVLDSTTMPHMVLAAEATPLTILRPLMGLLPAMVAEAAQRIGADAQEPAAHREPCPLRVSGPVDADRVRALEAERGWTLAAAASSKKEAA